MQDRVYVIIILSRPDLSRCGLSLTVIIIYWRGQFRETVLLPTIDTVEKFSSFNENKIRQNNIQYIYHYNEYSNYNRVLVQMNNRQFLQFATCDSTPTTRSTCAWRLRRLRIDADSTLRCQHRPYSQLQQESFRINSTFYQSPRVYNHSTSDPNIIIRNSFKYYPFTS